MSQVSIVSPNDPNAPPKVMTFDGAYYTDSTTESIYNELAFPLVEVSVVIRNLLLLQQASKIISVSISNDFSRNLLEMHLLF